MKNSLGQYFKDIRISKGLSLQTVFEETAITTSRLSKLERGLMQEPPAELLCRLSSYYEVSITDIFAVAGYAQPPTPILEHLPLLKDDELRVVQEMIDLLTKGRWNNGV